MVPDGEEVMGVNTRAELAKANAFLNEQELNWHSERGVTILSPFQTCIAKRVKIGRDTVIHPFTWIERGVEIGRCCEIGPFAKIRAGSKIDDGSVIGSFVEVVRSRVGANTLVKHLSYLGDATIGREVNVGAGTVTANFDGQRKHKTVVRDGARLGCNTVLIAPVTVGRNAKTGAGAVVCARKAVPPGTTVVGVPAKALGKGKAV
jgi:bifunctional UDP-N-acetylglucosamine pyrophosphorylase/glucosamine-1-phosphate N-acetyltransferase